MLSWFLVFLLSLCTHSLRESHSVFHYIRLKQRKKYNIILNQGRGNPSRNSKHTSLGHKSKAKPPSYSPPSPQTPPSYCDRQRPECSLYSLQHTQPLKHSYLIGLTNMYCAAVLITDKYCYTPTLVEVVSSNDPTFINL